MERYPIVSVDDHLLQSRDLWTTRLPNKLRSRAPHVEAKDDHEVWVFGDYVQDTLGMADVVGRNTNGADMFSPLNSRLICIACDLAFSMWLRNSFRYDSSSDAR